MSTLVAETKALNLSITEDKIRHYQVADPPYRRDLADAAAQRRGDGGAGVQEIDIAAARPRMTGRGDLGDPAIVAARPADLPIAHLADADRRLAA